MVNIDMHDVMIFSEDSFIAYDTDASVQLFADGIRVPVLDWHIEARHQGGTNFLPGARATCTSFRGESLAGKMLTINFNDGQLIKSATLISEPMRDAGGIGPRCYVLRFED